jgi:hypothetical protein
MAAYAITQSTTTWSLVFLMVLTSDHVSPLAGASPTVTLSKNGVAFGAAAGAVSEIANGWYKVAGNATDTNTLGPLVLHATAATGDPVDVVFEVVAYGPQSTSLGLTNVSSNAVQFAGQTITAAAGVTLPSSVASPTNITAGTITTVTNLTNAPTAGDFTATMKTSLNAATPASVTGSVGSVTGAVGSVTGSVGSVTGAVGSVTGSVGSVTGAVGSVTGSVGSVTGAVGSVTGSVGSVTAAVTVSGTSALTESYATAGAPFTLAQALYGLTQQIGQMSITGTTMTVTKRDGVTTAKTYTLNSATTPTSIVETT